ncbi:MAG: FtsX-like permease family protein, partial [Candidatus Acidiferrales bacterium]
NYLAGTNPIAQRITLRSWDGPWREVVGVVKDVRDIGLGERAQPQIYLPALQPWEGGNGLPPLDFVLIVRTTGNPRTVTGLLRDRILAVDRDVPVFRVRTLDEVVTESVSHYSFRGALLGSFALAALLLALVGVYGVVHYTVVCRTHEIGVRMVLGAQRSDILSMILREAAILALLAAIIGVSLTLSMGRLVASLLFGLKFYDPLTIGVSCLVIIAGVIGASLIPALRATRLEPARLIRYE